MSRWIRTGADGVGRCWWAGDDGDYLAYHDDEWGRPTIDDTRLFEKICLEGFQSGLSWLTILRKRDNFRAAFAGFEMDTVARFGEADVERLLGDAGIVRHRRKIESTINNAIRALEIVDEFGSLAGYLWGFEPDGNEVEPTDESPVPATTPTSAALARDLKGRGWSYVGPTTVYAFMQAMGMVNDHLPHCSRYQVCDQERRALVRPR